MIREVIAKIIYKICCLLFIIFLPPGIIYIITKIDTSLLACFESTKELFIIVCVNINIIYYLCTFVR